MTNHNKDIETRKKYFLKVVDNITITLKKPATTNENYFVRNEDDDFLMNWSSPNPTTVEKPIKIRDLFRFFCIILLVIRKWEILNVFREREYDFILAKIKIIFGFLAHLLH